MKTKREISDEILRFKIAANVAKAHGYLALSTILEDEMEGLDFACRNNRLLDVNEELLRLYEVLGETRYAEKTSEVMSLREKTNRKIRMLEWTKKEEN